MALQQIYKKSFRGVTWKSGHVYKFHYNAWQSDPDPVMILMYAYAGTHPTSGHEWTFFQGINFTYIPRHERRLFAASWVKTWEQSNGNMEFTWSTVKNRYPYLQNAVRRYFYSPSYYIVNPMEIPLEDMEDIIVSTWSKDFSKKIKTSIMQKARDVKANITAGLASGIFRFKR